MGWTAILNLVQIKLLEMSLNFKMLSFVFVCHRCRNNCYFLVSKIKIVKVRPLREQKSVFSVSPKVSFVGYVPGTFLMFLTVFAIFFVSQRLVHRFKTVGGKGVLGRYCHHYAYSKLYLHIFGTVMTVYFSTKFGRQYGLL